MPKASAASCPTCVKMLRLNPRKTLSARASSICTYSMPTQPSLCGVTREDTPGTMTPNLGLDTRLPRPHGILALT